MTLTLSDGRIDLHGLRRRLYDLVGLCFSAVSPAPACLPMLQASGAMASANGLFRCTGRVRGKGFNGKRFSAQEISANVIDPISGTPAGFDGYIVSLSHTLRVLGRTVVVPDLGALNPRHRDGMKRVGFAPGAFEQRFEVYSDDQVEGRALIPVDFMERLIDFDDRSPGGCIRIAFSGRQMHAVIPTGDTARISEEYWFSDLKLAADMVAVEMARVFALVAEVDRLHSKADRHCTEARNRAREDFYATAAASIAPAVAAALANGLLVNDPRARHLTENAWMIEERLRGLLLPRV